MIANRRLKRSIPTFMCFLAPLVLVKGASMFLGGAGPMGASASPISPAYEPVELSTMQTARAEGPSDESRAAAERATAIRESAEAHSGNPFYYESREAAAPAMIEQIEQTTLLDVELQAIMASSRGNTALIDGRPYRNGDVLPGGVWTVASISSDDRAVVIRNIETGEERRLVVRTPG